ncbi:MAG TPA: tyrosine-type recombinase/integrase [Steroidobacteraceae bacterium]
MDLWDEFPELQLRVKDALRSYARNSQLALRADWRCWRAWCADQTPALPPLPAQAPDVVAFVLSCSPATATDARGVLIPSESTASPTVRAASTVRRYLHTLSAFHRLARLPDPTRDPEVVAVRRRVTRGRGAMRQKTGINRPLLEELLSVLEGTLWDRRTRALLLTAYCTLARSAELVALHVEDLAVSDSGDGYAVIRTSKSDQEGLGSHRYLAAPAITALREWLEATGIREGYVFRRIHKFGGVTLKAIDSHEVARILRATIRRLPEGKRPVGSFAGHSTRIGAAQDLVASGQDLLSVMQSGGWKDPKMPARYTEHLAAMRGGMAQLWGRMERDESSSLAPPVPLIAASG